MPFPVQNFNLYNFRNVIGDTAKSYMFLVTIPAVALPTGEELTCFARSTTLPPYNIQTTEIPFQGLNYKVATVPSFDNWSIEFLADEAHILRHRMLGWTSQIYDAQRQVAGSPLSYKADNIIVAQLNRAGGIVSQYNFVGAFPATVGEITLDHSNTDPESFSVEFAYDYYTVGLGNSTSADDTEANIFIKLNQAFPTASAVAGATTGATINGEQDVNTATGSNLGVRVSV